MFFTLFGYWAHGGGGVSQGIGIVVHNLLVQFFTLDSSKIEVFQTYFFDTLITQNDHPSHVKHVLGHIHVFLTLFGYWAQGGGGGAPFLRFVLTAFCAPVQ